MKSIKKKEWVKELLYLSKGVYLVGGCVRDHILLKESKDIDILVIGLEENKIINILSQFGKVDMVGESFGVIKFKPNDEEEVYDIALPRKEVKISDGHKGFKIEVDHNFTLNDDLVRRDFKINTICYDLRNEIIVDLFGGVNDIKNKLISCVSEKSFIEDPLRILRGLQFAARFNMEIDEVTYKLMFENISLVKELSGERILIEFEKVISKSCNIFLFAKLLYKLSFLDTIFQGEITQKEPLAEDFAKIKSLAEMLFLFFKDIVGEEKIHLIGEKLKLSNDTLSELIGLYGLNELVKNQKTSRKQVADLVNRTSEAILVSELFPDFKIIQIEFIVKKYPLSLKGLEINGGDLIRMGYKPGVLFKEVLNKVHEEILNDKLQNNRLEIISFVKTKYEV